MKKLKITVNGTAYDVIVEEIGGGVSAPVAYAAPVASAPIAVSAPTRAPAPVAAGGAGSVPSPLAGRVVAINAKVGQTVAAGDTLITLEAMKMNTLIASPAAGTVKEIHVKEGDAVEEGQALVTVA